MVREQKAILEVTPDRLLKEEFLDAHQLSQSALSRRTGMPRSSINEIIKGKRAISAEIAFTPEHSPEWIRSSGLTCKVYDLHMVQFDQADPIRARMQPLVA